MRFVGYWQKIKGADAYAKFLHHYPIKSYKKGTVILSEGETPRSAYVIKKGIVRAHLLTSQGETKPAGLQTMGDVFPMEWVFDRAEHAVYYFDAFTDVRVRLVPKDSYLKFIFSNHETLAFLLRRMIDKYIASQLRVSTLEFSKASEKVLHRLHYLCLYYGREIKKDTVEIRLPLTQQELANSMGLTRETTGIELKKLERAGVLSRKNSHYIVKTNKLDDLLDEEYELRRTETDRISEIEV